MDAIPNNPLPFVFLSILLTHDVMVTLVALLLIPLGLSVAIGVLCAGSIRWLSFRAPAGYLLSGFYFGLVLVPIKIAVPWFDAAFIVLAYLSLLFGLWLTRS